MAIPQLTSSLPSKRGFFIFNIYTRQMVPIWKGLSYRRYVIAGAFMFQMKPRSLGSLWLHRKTPTVFSEYGWLKPLGLEKLDNSATLNRCFNRTFEDFGASTLCYRPTSGLQAQPCLEVSSVAGPSIMRFYEQLLQSLSATSPDIKHSRSFKWMQSKDFSVLWIWWKGYAPL